MKTKERKDKRRKRFELLCELERLVETDGNSNRVDEIRKELNSLSKPQQIDFNEEVVLPISFEQYLKLRMFNLTDKQIIEVYDIQRSQLIRFKRYHGLYVAYDLKKKLDQMKLLTC